MSLKKVRRKISEIRKVHPLVEIYSDHPENLLIIDQEHKLLVTVSAKGNPHISPSIITEGV